MDLPVCYTPLWVSPSDKPVDDRLVNSCQVLRYQYIYYMPLWAHVQVLPPDVVVAIDDIGLVAEAHAPHVLLRQADKPLFAQAILRVGIEGDVQDGLLGLAVGCEVITERAGKMPYRVGVIALRLDNPAGEKHVGVPFVHLQLVVGKHPVQAAAMRDLGYHRTGYLLRNSSTSAEIRLLNSTSSRVCRSSL